METRKENVDEIKPTDIVFDCPHCQKSLAIDYRAAGLTIKCSDCQEVIEVPIPEGMDLADFDSSEEDMRARAIHLRESLMDAQSRVRLLESKVSEMEAERNTLEKDQIGLSFRVRSISREIDVMNQAFEQMTAALKSLTRALEQEPP